MHDAHYLGQKNRLSWDVQSLPETGRCAVEPGAHGLYLDIQDKLHSALDSINDSTECFLAMLHAYVRCVCRNFACGVDTPRWGWHSRLYE